MFYFRYEKDVHLFKSKVVDSVRLCNSHLFDPPKIDDPYAIRLVNRCHLKPLRPQYFTLILLASFLRVSFPLCLNLNLLVHLVFHRGIQLYTRKQKSACSHIRYFYQPVKFCH